MTTPLSNAQLNAECRQLLAPLNRRSFLKAALASASGVGITLTGCSSPNEQTIPYQISADHAQLMRRMMQLTLPVAGTDLPDPLSGPLINHVERTLAALDADVRKDLGLGMDLFNYGSVLLGRHWSRFVYLGDSDGIAYIERWQNGHAIQRGIVSTIKKILYLNYWRIPETWQALSFDGPVSDRWGLVALGNTPIPD